MTDDHGAPPARLRGARKQLRLALEDVDDHAARASVQMALDATHDALADLDETDQVQPTATDGGTLDVSQGLLIQVDGSWHHSTTFDGHRHETACGLETDDAPWTIRRPPDDPDGPRCDDCFPKPVTDGGRGTDLETTVERGGAGTIATVDASIDGRQLSVVAALEHCTTDRDLWVVLDALKAALEDEPHVAVESGAGQLARADGGDSRDGDRDGE